MSDFGTAQLGDICDINPDTLAESSDASARYRYIDLSSVNEQKIDLSMQPQLFSALPSRARRKVRCGDVLLGTVRPNLKNFAFVSSSDEDLVASTGFAVLRSKEKLSNAGFIFHLINSDIVGSQLNALVTGSNYPAVNAGQVAELLIPFPPLPEQKKIAEILSGIEELIQAEDEAIDTLSCLLDAHLCSGRFSFGERVAMSKACLLVADCMHKTPVFEDKGFPLVRTPNVRCGKLVFEGMKYISESSYQEWTRKDKPEPGDILFTREAPLGEACIVPSGIPLCIGQRMMLLRANNEFLSPEFLLFRLRSRLIQRRLQLLSGGSTVGHANVKDIRALEIEIPSFEVQSVAVSIYESISRSIDAHASKKQKLLLMKMGLSTDLLSGRKRVSV